MLEFTAIALFVAGVAVFVLGFTLIGKGNLASAGTVAKNSGIIVLALSPLIIILDGVIGLQVFATSLLNDVLAWIAADPANRAASLAGMGTLVTFLTGLDIPTLVGILGGPGGVAIVQGAIAAIPKTTIDAAASNIASSVMYIPVSLGILAGLVGGILVTIGITLEKGTMDFPPIGNFAIFGAVYTTIAGVFLLLKGAGGAGIVAAKEITLINNLAKIPAFSGLSLIPTAVMLVGAVYLLLTVLLALIALTAYGKLQFKPMGIALIAWSFIAFLIPGFLILMGLTPTYITPLIP